MDSDPFQTMRKCQDMLRIFSKLRLLYCQLSFNLLGLKVILNIFDIHKQLCLIQAKIGAVSELSVHNKGYSA